MTAQNWETLEYMVSVNFLIMDPGSTLLLWMQINIFCLQLIAYENNKVEYVILYHLKIF
jgi:hypothetical protein